MHSNTDSSDPANAASAPRDDGSSSVRVPKRIGHYQLEEVLGRGSMGVVYRAIDTRLRRYVALKLIRENAADPQNLRIRFQQEARAASHLEHPNVATVYEFGDAKGQLYLAMAYYPGETLSERNVRERPGVTEALHIGCGIARALNHAHVRHVVHRDIKPGNVLLHQSETGVIPKVLDFGIAKVQDAEDLTEHGKLIGTPAYLSPEMIDGDAVDHRTDLWSLGVVLYEMLTGRRPFSGKTTIQLLLNIRTGELEPLTDPIPDAGLAALVHQLLEKDPALRPASAGAIADELFRIAQLLESASTMASGYSVSIGSNPLQPLQTECRLAVVPFQDLSPAQSHDYFTEGLTDELTWALSAVTGLRLVPGSATAKAQSDGLDIGAMGHRLGVTYFLEGTVRRMGAQLRITCRLLNVIDGIILWQDRLDRELTDLLGVQEEIAQRLVASLPLKSTGGGPARLLPDRAHTKDPEAYEFYLQARAHLADRTADDFRKAIDLFEQSLSVDPDYALAFAGLADAHVLLSGPYGGAPPKEGMEAAAKAVRSALERAPELAEAHCSLGCIQCFYEWDFDRAVDTFRRSLSLADSYVTAHQWFAMNLLMIERYDAAESALQRAAALDSASIPVSISIGLVAYCRGDTQQAIDRYAQVIEANPKFGLVHFFLGEAHAERDDFDQAIQSLELARDLTNNTVEVLASLAATHARAGNTQQASTLLRDIEQRAEQGYVSKYRLAQVELAMGNEDVALAHLERALAERCADLVWLQARPTFAPLRGKPAFEEIRARVFERPSQVTTLVS